MTVTSKRKPTHGGKRKGAGRPPASKLNPDRLVRATVFLDPRVHADMFATSERVGLSLGGMVTLLWRHVDTDEIQHRASRGKSESE